MMNTVTKVCVLAVVISLVLAQCARADYLDCEMECVFAAFRRKTLCKCGPPVKLHWGKRTPRTRTRKLPTFRYGKRESPFVNSEYNTDMDDSRLDALRTIQALRDSGEYDI